MNPEAIRALLDQANTILSTAMNENHEATRALDLFETNLNARRDVLVRKLEKARSIEGVSEQQLAELKREVDEELAEIGKAYTVEVAKVNTIRGRIRDAEAAIEAYSWALQKAQAKAGGVATEAPAPAA